MSIIPKETIIKQLEDYFQVQLRPIKSKQIMYEGILSNKLKIVVCTPSSKLYPRGNGWVDINMKQLDLFEKADYKIMVMRLEGGNVYYMHLGDLIYYCTPESMVYNKIEGDHWKLYLWPDDIQVLGNKELFKIQPNNLNNL